MKPRILPLLAVCLSLLAISACSGKAGAEPTGQAIKAATSYNLSEIRKPWKPKAWTGASLGEGTLRSGSFDGAVTVVNFWASWCGPCRAEQAELEKLYEKYAPQGVRFLGVNIRDEKTNARAHVEEFGVTYPSVFNPDSTIAFKYRVLFIPTTFVLDRGGRVAWKIIGPTREPDLIRAIESEIAA
jgi:thiol-disulfide isomerase/thioredoxin